jgi:hypothetical protein
MKVAIRHIAGAFARLEKSRLVRKLREAHKRRPENARAARATRRSAFAAKGPVFGDRDWLVFVGDHSL